MENIYHHSQLLQVRNIWFAPKSQTQVYEDNTARIKRTNYVIGGRKQAKHINCYYQHPEAFCACLDDEASHLIHHGLVWLAGSMATVVLFVPMFVWWVLQNKNHLSHSGKGKWPNILTLLDWSHRFSDCNFASVTSEWQWSWLQQWQISQRIEN